MMMRNVDEAASPTVILTEKALGTWIGPRAVTHDGKWVLCARADPAANTARLRLVGLEGDHEEREVFSEAGTQWKCDFSPDDRWIVYESDPDGITEVFVRPNPLQAGTGSVKSESGGSERITVSAHGGRAPMWSPDGKTIVFREGRSKLVAVDVTMEPTFRVSTPRELFDWESLEAETDITNLSPDGKHIAFAQKAEGERTVTQINLVQNWGREVREKARAGGK
jgi:Tol biopolymer transport system component